MRYAAFALIFTFSPLFSYGALIDDVTVHYDMDETSGVRYDSVGSLDLTDNNTVLYGTGVISNGGDFERSNSEYLSHSDNTVFDLSNNFSINLWFDLETTTSGIANVLLSKRGGASDKSYVLKIATANSLALQASSNGSSFDRDTSVTWTEDLGLHMLTVTWADGSVCYYIDASLVSTCQAAGGTTIFNSTGDFNIGREATGSDHFDGIIDEVAIFNSVLTTDQITTLYNSGSGLAYPFDESTASEEAGNTSSTTPIAVDNLTAVHFQFFAFLVMMIGFWTVIWIWSIHRR